MVLNIATWNLCLGLFHKKDYVRNLLYENNIDVLNLQETELGPDIDLKNLNIKGYALEVETNENKKRVATYIKTSVQYKRRNDLEKPNLHLIILDIQANPQLRIITLYRTFRPQDASSPREHFQNQLHLINEATTNNTVLLGDMNLDENKRYAVDYNQRSLFRDFDEIIGHHQYTQHVTEATWERVIENQVKSSIIDHIYCTNSTSVEKVAYVDTTYGDHRLVLLKILDEAKIEQIALQRRNWRN
jgi:exonuclease III